MFAYGPIVMVLWYRASRSKGWILLRGFCVNLIESYSGVVARQRQAMIYTSSTGAGEIWTYTTAKGVADPRSVASALFVPLGICRTRVESCVAASRSCSGSEGSGALVSAPE